MSLASHDDNDEADKTAASKLSKTRKGKSKQRQKKATPLAAATAATTTVVEESKTSLPVKSNALTAITTKQDTKNEAGKRDVSEWGNAPSDQYANVIEKNMIALSALRMDAVDRTNEIDDVSSSDKIDKGRYAIIDAHEQGANKTAAD